MKTTDQPTPKELRTAADVARRAGLVSTAEYIELKADKIEREQLPPGPPHKSIAVSLGHDAWQNCGGIWMLVGTEETIGRTWAELHRDHAPITVIYDPSKPARTYDPEIEIVVQVTDLPDRNAGSFQECARMAREHGWVFDAQTFYAVALAFDRRDRERGQS